MDQVVPNKWKKHLLLVEFGFKTQSDLENEVKRYPKEDVFQLVDYLKRKLGEASMQNAYILSLIPKIDYFKLPNYIVKNKEDLNGFIDFVNKKEGSFSEIWCFEKERRAGLDHVIGRISFNTANTFRVEPEHIIEQVWSVNHRDIEHYSKLSKVNYLRASREGWHRRYAIDSINIIDKNDRSKIVNDFICVAKNIEANRDKIENLLEFLKEIEISEVVLEYMLVEDKFKFIDWDTSNDKKVIDSVFKKDREELERI